MQTTRSGNLYDYPKYYDLIFGADWKAEFDFLLACFAAHAQRSVQRVFEPACGTGRLLWQLAKAGYDASGNDLNKHAVAYCNARLTRHRLPATAVVGDMSDFRLRRKVDAAFNMINSFRHLTSAKAAKGHLESVASGLAKGGIFVLGLHLTPTRGTPIEEEHWKARRGTLMVRSQMQTKKLDRRSRCETIEMVFHVETPTQTFRLIDTFDFRTYTARQMSKLLANVDALDLVATYDFAYDIQRPIGISAETEDVVYVLRRR